MPKRRKAHAEDMKDMGNVIIVSRVFAKILLWLWAHAEDMGNVILASRVFAKILLWLWLCLIFCGWGGNSNR